MRREKGKGWKNRRKWKRVEEDNDDDYKEAELQESWRAFVMAQMMKMDSMLDRLVKENEELRKEVREMQRANTEDWREYFWEVGKVRKDMRVMERWVRRIVEWVEDKKLEKESEGKSEDRLEDGEMRQEMEIQELEKKNEETEKEIEAKGEKKMGDEMVTDKETEEKAEEEKTVEEKRDGDVEML